MSIPGAASPLFLSAAAAPAGAYQIDRSIRLNSGDSAYLNRTPSSAGNRKTWTYSTWIKRSNLTASDYVHIFGVVTSGASLYSVFLFKTGADSLQFFAKEGLTTPTLETANLLRDPSAWYHIVLSVDTTQAAASDRAKIYINGVEASYAVDNRSSVAQNTDLNINNTLAHEIGGNPSYTSTRYFDGYLAEIHLVDGQALAPTDFGEYDSDNNWNPKAYSGSYGTNGFYLKFDDNSTDAALGTDSSGNGNTWTVNNITGPGGDHVYSAALSVPEGGGFNSSYPAANAFDGDTSTYALPANTSTSLRWTYNSSFNLSGAVEIYVIGAGMTVTFDDGRTSVYAGSDSYTQISSAVDFTWFNVYQGAGYRGNLAAVRVGGTVLIDSTGANSDSLIDTPTNYTADSGNNGGNYCTWNSLDNAGTLANGNLDFSNSAGSNQAVRSTFAFPDSGKWYAEFTTGEQTTIVKGVAFGFANSSAGLTDNPSISNRWDIYADAVGYIFANGSTLTSSLGTFAAGTLLQIAYDADTGKAWVGKNNTWYNSSGGTTGNPSSGTNQTFTLSGTIFLYALCYANSGVLNAGQRPFAYTPPTGYLSLCTENLPDPTIADGSTAFDVKTYSGTGSSNSITGLNFSPDLVWIKCRSTSGTDHTLADSVRGLGTNGAYRRIFTSLTNAEQDDGYDVTSLDTGGFTLASGGDYSNASGRTYVGWSWDGGSSTSSNSDGSITSSVRVSQTNGFSIISYTGNSTVGATVGHGLNDVPGLVIIKNRTTGSLPWVIKMTGMTGGQRLQFDTGAVYTENAGSGSVWNATNPSSSVITLGDINYSNASSNNYIGYCWAPVSGYSAFGSYTASGATNGSFVFTGMRPRLIMIKAFSSAGDMSYASWLMVDSERDTYNVSDAGLFANLAAVEGTRGNGTASAGTWLDILSNGFKIRYNGTEVNGVSGQTYMYAAWAEHPFKTSRAR